jgi:acyl carrier protein
LKHPATAQGNLHRSRVPLEFFLVPIDFSFQFSAAPERYKAMENENLKKQIKEMMVENLMLQVTAEQIADDQPLFGPESLGLDSVDALQLVVSLDKTFGLKIPDPSAAKEILQSVNHMAQAVQSNPGA